MSTNDAKVRLFRLGDELIQILMSGELSAQTNWQPGSMEQFPASDRQKAAQAMLVVLADFSTEKATAFIEKHYSPGIVERNGKARLIGMLQMLSEDSGGNPVKAVNESEGRLQLLLPARSPAEKLKISLTFLGDQVDKLQAEMEGN